MLKFYENVQRQFSATNILCPNCGAANSVEAKQCLKCENRLLKPMPFGLNVLGAFIAPRQAFERIAATAPVKQAGLIVILTIALYLLQQTLGSLFYLESVLADPTSLSNAARDQLLGLPSPPTPDLIAILLNYIFLFVNYIFLTVSIFYTARLFFREEARANFWSLLAIVGFARITMLARFLIFLPVLELAFAGVVIALLWQLALLTVGVKYSTGLPWTKAALLAGLPLVFFGIILGLPI